VQILVEPLAFSIMCAVGLLFQEAHATALPSNCVVCCFLQVGDGQTLLMDAGCEYHGYVSDVTRTWPVNGRYTAEQRQVYETVLEVRRR
jgi:Xaa-Pro aminopeptidase